MPQNLRAFRLELEVPADNATAQRLFRSFGFRPLSAATTTAEAKSTTTASASALARTNGVQRMVLYLAPVAGAPFRLANVPAEERQSVRRSFLYEGWVLDVDAAQRLANARPPSFVDLVFHPRPLPLAACVAFRAWFVAVRASSANRAH